MTHDSSMKMNSLRGKESEEPDELSLDKRA